MVMGDDRTKTMKVSTLIQKDYPDSLIISYVFHVGPKSVAKMCVCVCSRVVPGEKMVERVSETSTF